MSEAPAAEAAAPKKKGKLPVIIALVAVLAGGGFFMVKSKGAKKAKPAVKLGPISDIKEEFLVNLKDAGGNYLRVAVSLQFADGVKAEEVEKSMPAMQDLINLRLRSKSLGEIRSLEGTKLLKRQIAADINSVLSESEKKDGEEKPPEKAEEKIPDGWDSAKGPVLKVLFRSFAWQ